MAVATVALVAQLGFVVVDDGNHHVAAIAPGLGPAAKRHALAGELLAHLGTGFKRSGCGGSLHSLLPFGWRAQMTVFARLVALMNELWNLLFPFARGFMEINISIGNRLREEREAIGKTQSELAAVAAAWGVPGATRQSQAKYEKGLASPSAAYLAAIKSAGVDVLYVLSGETDKQKMRALALDEQFLLDSYREASPAVRKAALAALLSGGSASGGQSVVGNNAIQIGNVAGKARIKNK